MDHDLIANIDDRCVGPHEDAYRFAIARWCWQQSEREPIRVAS